MVATPVGSSERPFATTARTNIALLVILFSTSNPLALATALTLLTAGSLIIDIISRLSQSITLQLFFLVIPHALSLFQFSLRTALSALFTTIAASSDVIGAVARLANNVPSTVAAKDTYDAISHPTSSFPNNNTITVLPTFTHQQPHEPVSGRDQFSWIVWLSDPTALNQSQTCSARARPVFWTVIEHLRLLWATMTDTRRLVSNERPPDNSVSSIAWLTPPIPLPTCSLLMLPSGTSPTQPSGPSLNLWAFLKQVPMALTGLTTIDDVATLPADVAHHLPSAIVLVLLPDQLHQWCVAADLPLVLAAGRQQLVEHAPQCPNQLVLVLVLQPRHELFPTMFVATETEESTCHNLPHSPVVESYSKPKDDSLSMFSGIPPVGRTTTRDNKHRPLVHQEEPVSTRKWRILRPLISGNGATSSNVNGNPWRRRKQRCHQSHHPMRQASLRSRVTQPVQEGTNQTQTNIKPTPAPALIHATHSTPVTTATMVDSSSDDEGLFPRPSLDLVREALKLETAQNTLSVTLIQKLNRIRLRYGQTRWDQLKANYPSGITYTPSDYSTLRRQFLDLYETWLWLAEPLPSPPAELLGKRRKSTRSPMKTVPEPLPVALQDTDPITSLVLRQKGLPETPPNRSVFSIPPSAWLSTQGARLSAILAGFPRASPYSSVQGNRTLPGHYPSSGASGVNSGEIPTAELHKENERSYMEFDSFADLRFPPARRTESLYSEEQSHEDGLEHSPEDGLERSPSSSQDHELPPWEGPSFSDHELPPWDDPLGFSPLGFERLHENQSPYVDEENEEENDEEFPSFYYPPGPLFARRQAFERQTRLESSDSFSEADERVCYSPQQKGKERAVEPRIEKGWRPQLSDSSSSLSSLLTSSPTSTHQHHPQTAFSTNDLQSFATPTPLAAFRSSRSSSSVSMVSFSETQFTSLLTAITGAMNGAGKPVSFKDAKVGIFYPGMPVDASHPAGRSCVVNGQTYYRSARLMKSEIEAQKEALGGAEVAKNLPSKLEGQARAWWRDILTKTDRENMLKDDSCELWISKLLTQFERDDEDPLAALYENKFTVARLRAGDDIVTWAMEQSSIIAEAGFSDARKVKALYCCFDADLKNEFGPPAESTLMTAYMSLIQTKAHVYRQKILQRDQETRSMQARTLNDLISVIRQTGRSVPQAALEASSLGAPAPVSVQISTTRQTDVSPYARPSNQGVAPFTGRPCRHCDGAHMDNTCPQRPNGAGSRPCRFCAGAHMDHACPQKPVGFKNCANCNGTHYGCL
ncbi:hypothetical protein BJ508DRAFT_336439 [Ascobolus immersus RN42]|uniref:Uncharacterized protein n=1 Tax=Ascobolus immersus RN42 TaxID=1160509 RepID=A0A3N4HF64_ASCIM|nr:hypothetical protein BJ508DRAFT_336439 [Ascobolus immersus RN42]